MRIQLTYIGHAGKPITLTANPPDNVELVIGRRDGAFTPYVNLSWDLGVSRRHARIYYDLKTWYIEQLTETNQTHLKWHSIVEGVEQDHTVDLLAGIPYELPSEVEIVFGREGRSIVRCIRLNDEAEPLPEGVTTLTGVDTLSSPVDEIQRIEWLSRITTALRHPRQTALDKLIEALRQAFPSTTHAGLGIALYEGREIFVPAYYPPGTARISFTLARRAIHSQQTLRWDRSVASSASQEQASLKDIVQTLYAPIRRGARSVGVIYLNSTTIFKDSDLPLLNIIVDILGASIDFQPRSTDFQVPSMFLSYSPEDEAFARRFAADLRRQRTRVWLSTEQLRPGQQQEPQIAEAIRVSDAVVLLLSPTALSSRSVMREIEQAQRIEKRIIPLRYGQVDILPAELALLKSVDIVSNYKDGVLELIEELYNLVDFSMQGQQASGISLLASGQKPQVLLLAADPQSTKQLDLSEEFFTLNEYLRSANDANQVDLKWKWIVRASEFLELRFVIKPDIIHFSGRTSNNGEIRMENHAGETQPVDPKDLKALFNALKSNDASKNIRCVVLSACFTEPQAQAIAEEVDCVIGLSRPISDKAIIEFAKFFYRALQQCWSLQQAYDIASLCLGFSDGQHKPRLLLRNAGAGQLKFCEADRVIIQEGSAGMSNTISRSDAQVTIGFTPIGVGRSNIPSSDVERLVVLISDIAANAASDSKVYYKNLLRKSNIPDKMTFQVFSQLVDNPEYDARTIINWAISKGTNPNSGEQTLGDILLNTIADVGLEDRSIIVEMIAKYRLCNDVSILARLGLPSQMDTTIKNYVGFGPDFDWNGPRFESQIDYQAWLQPPPNYLDVGFFRKMVECTEHVCRLEIVGKNTYGTGVLLDSRHVLSAFHTFTRNLNNPEFRDIREPQLEVKLLFNYYSGAQDKPQDTVVLSVDSAIIRESPTSELDFVILRMGEPRKNIRKLAESTTVGLKNGVNILQHPMGDEMKLAVGLTNDTIVSIDEDRGIFQYVTRASKGSSGAPCFDNQWNLVGMHHAERTQTFGTRREGILYSAIKPYIRDII
jgi:hypothetical protein